MGTSAQSTRRILMVRPARFGFNEETAESNPWQHRDDGPDTALQAEVEHDTLVSALRSAGVDVSVLQDEPSPARPDAVFPNNWFSVHPDQTVFLYPMATPSRRLERRLEAVLSLTGIVPSRVVDLTSEEAHGRFLEGTGSLVFDHLHQVAWACASPRTHPDLARRTAETLGYTLEWFDASDARGDGVYHTNVVLAIGTHFAVVGASNVAPRDRARVLGRLRETGREVIEVSADAISAFAGNVLELQASSGLVLACSSRAWGVLAAHRERLGVSAVVVVPIPTIERVGGGSVRCMIAELW